MRLNDVATKEELDAILESKKYKLVRVVLHCRQYDHLINNYDLAQDLMLRKLLGK